MLRRPLLAAAAVAALAQPAAADPFADFGTAMKYGLPLAAAVCAARDDRLEDFAVRGALQTVVVLGLKTWLDGTPVSVRPNGEGRVFRPATPQPRPSARRIWRASAFPTTARRA
ncbi:hypothetical protein ACFSYD_13870 [Paracoccus aerius]